MIYKGELEAELALAKHVKTELEALVVKKNKQLDEARRVIEAMRTVALNSSDMETWTLLNNTLKEIA